MHHGCDPCALPPSVARPWFSVMISLPLLPRPLLKWWLSIIKYFSFQTILFWGVELCPGLKGCNFLGQAVRQATPTALLWWELEKRTVSNLVTLSCRRCCNCNCYCNAGLILRHHTWDNDDAAIRSGDNGTVTVTIQLLSTQSLNGNHHITYPPIPRPPRCQ